MAGLLTYLTLLWGWRLTKMTAFKITLLGVELSSEFLWMITPAVLTIFVLALIGAMNIMGPIWKRFRKCCTDLGIEVFWTDTDPNKTMIDFFTYLRVRPEVSVEPANQEMRYRLASFAYPSVITLATLTTSLAASYPGAAYSSYRTYAYGCVLVQLLFSFRIWYRAICRFFGVRKEQTGA